MGMSGTFGNAVGKRRHHRRPVMSEINVTPMVDVMLVLLIIFMVSAPLLTVGVPIDLPQSQAKSLDQDREPLAISLNGEGKVFLQNTEIGVEELVPRLKAISDARGGGFEERIFVRGDRIERVADASAPIPAGAGGIRTEAAANTRSIWIPPPPADASMLGGGPQQTLASRRNRSI